MFLFTFIVSTFGYQVFFNAFVSFLSHFLEILTQLIGFETGFNDFLPLLTFIFQILTNLNFNSKSWGVEKGSKGFSAIEVKAKNLLFILLKILEIEGLSVHFT